MAREVRAVDLFAGCGGLSLGLEMAGFSVIGAIERDPLAAETYAANHPAAHVWAQDIREVSSSELSAALKLHAGQLELLAGCPPCQGFSRVRTLNGKRIVNDPRNGLVSEFGRFIRDLKPLGVLLENVPGLQHDQEMVSLRRTLAVEGYFTTEGVLDAADFGVPQRRRRYVLLASRIGPVDFGAPRRRRRRVRDAIARLPAPGSSGDALHDFPQKHTDRVTEMIRQVPKDGGSRAAIALDLQLACHRSFDGFKDVYGRMAWHGVAPTITAGCWNPSKGRFLHPWSDRAITMREAAILQGFPRSYRFPAHRGKTRVGELIGNAFPPEFARRHAVMFRRQLVAAG